jgi:hypothetical protein
MKHWCTTPSVLGLVALVILSGSSVRGQSYDWHRESFLVYFRGGLTLPTGEETENLNIGLHGGLGIGIVLASGQTVSPELTLGVIFSRVSREKTYHPTVLDVERTGQGETYFGLELRFRYQNGRRLRPFVTLGGGWSSGNEDWIGDGALAIGGGADLATTSVGHRLLFGELRLIQSSPSLILLSLGLRFG